MSLTVAFGPEWEQSLSTILMMAGAETHQRVAPAGTDANVLLFLFSDEDGTVASAVAACDETCECSHIARKWPD